jgi:hypothetical protein
MPEHLLKSAFDKNLQIKGKNNEKIFPVGFCGFGYSGFRL